MLIKCEKCKTKFVLDEKFVKTTGSNVRCSKCKNVFVVYPEFQDDTSLSIQKDGLKKATPKIKEEKIEEKVEEKDEEIKEVEEDEEEIEDEDEEIEEDEEVEDEDEEIEEDVEEDEEEIEDEDEEIEEDEEEDEDEDEEIEEDEEEDEEEVEDEDEGIEEDVEEDEEEVEDEDEEIEEDVEEDEEEDEDEDEEIEEDVEEDEEEVEDEDEEIIEEDVEEDEEEDEDEDEDEIIEKEEDLDLKNDELITETTIDELKKEKEKEIKKKNKKGLFWAIFFTMVMIAITTFSIYFLHNFLLKTDKKRVNLLESAIDQNSNAIIPEEKSVSDNVRSFLQEAVGKAEKYPDIVAISSTINSAQIINNKIGYIKLITGKIINKSATTYKVIKIKGTLSTNTNAKAREEVVVCGNMLSRQEIRNFSLDEIKKRLYDDKSSGATASLPPGQRKDFLIIFYNLPNELTTYHINVVSALPVK